MAAEPIRIGLSLGLTGKYAVPAGMMEQSYRLWETHVNERGGILGRPVQVTIYDDHSDPDRAKTLYRDMIEHEHVDFLIGPYSSPITLAILPITEQHGYPILTPAATADTIWQQGYRYVFGVYPPGKLFALGFFELLRMYNLDTLAVISLGGFHEKSVDAGLESAHRLGLKVVLREIIPQDTRRFEALAQAVKASGAQALLVLGYFNDAVDMRRALKAIDWYPQAYYALGGPPTQDYYDQLGILAEHSFTTVIWKYYEKMPFPGSREFYEAFTTAYQAEPTHNAAAAYAACVILKAAIEQAGGTDRERVRDMLSSLDMMTLLGRYSVDQDGMQIRHSLPTIQWINGKQEVVWPPKLQTAQPVILGGSQ